MQSWNLYTGWVLIYLKEYEQSDLDRSLCERVRWKGIALYFGVKLSAFLFHEQLRSTQDAVVYDCS
jgi:hypothetical protein